MYPAIDAQITELLQQFSPAISNEELAGILITRAASMLVTEKVITLRQSGELLVTCGTLIQQFKDLNAAEGEDAVIGTRPTR